MKMEKKITTAKNIVNRLNNQGIYSSIGCTVFNFMNINRTVGDKSIVGYIFQDWLEAWFDKNNIYYRTNPNTQEPPDFYLNPKSDEIDLLEVKVFDITAGANFDLSNFESYCAKIEEQPLKLDADYLIFGYKLISGKLKIKKIWLKKIWEISCPSKAYPIKIQQKRNVIYNIRPAVWYGKNTTFKPFDNKKEFVKAMAQTLHKYKKTSAQAKSWYNKVCKHYKKQTGRDLFLNVQF